MTYHVALNGTKQDPMSEEALRALLASGSLGAEALCWREGWGSWQSVTIAFPEYFRDRPVPPAPPASAGATVTAQTPPAADAETLRKKYLNHEASLRSVGILYLIAAFLFVIGGLALLGGFSPEKTPGQIAPWILGLIILTIGILYFFTGRWLRALNPKGRTPATIFSVIGLLNFPLGTLISGYILYLLRSKKGTFVFSEEYQGIIAATPHIRYKTSLIIWLLLGLVLLFVIIGMISAIASSAHHG